MTTDNTAAPSDSRECLKHYNVLYVEDDADIRQQLEAFLRRRVGGLLTASHGEDGLALFREQQPDIVITDILPVMDGLTMVKAIRTVQPNVPVVITTAFNEADFLLQAIDLGVDAYVLKPIKAPSLEAALQRCARKLRLENTLLENNRLLRSVLSRLNEAVFILEAADGTVYDCNKAAETLFGYPRDEIIGHIPICLGFDWTHISRPPTSTLEAISLRQERLHRKTGETFFAEHYVYPIFGNKDQLAYIVSVVRDISEQKQREDSLLDRQSQLDFLAHHDPLTGLTNRLLFLDRLRHALARTRRNHQPLAVLFLDLDHFKAVNDHHGHNLGDVLLQAVAQRLLANVREQDTVARFGGDEFVLLLEEPGDAYAVERVANSLIKALGQPFDVRCHCLQIGASIGISLLGDRHEDAETLIRQADVAMYQAKRAGGGCFRLYGDASSI